MSERSIRQTHKRICESPTTRIYLPDDDTEGVDSDNDEDADVTPLLFAAILSVVMILLLGRGDTTSKDVKMEIR